MLLQENLPKNILEIARTSRRSHFWNVLYMRLDCWKLLKVGMSLFSWWHLMLLMEHPSVIYELILLLKLVQI